ncbi:MAG: hypothetical protein HQM13_21835 [SAR324 cluster bacterium]|nr:hypothetical protein [SAR324 cluster bacterium]
MKSPITEVLDHYIEKNFKSGVNRFLQGYELGELLHCDLDLKNNSAALSIELTGEEIPLNVLIDQYEILEEKGGVQIRIDEIKIDRKWIQVLATKFVKGRVFEVPGEIMGSFA